MVCLVVLFSEKMLCRNGSCGSECPAIAKLRTALNGHFKFSDFRPGQLEAMLPAAHGRDSFIRMATGSGKSLCMFLPPLAVSSKAMGVVISPLHALMDQQVCV